MAECGANYNCRDKLFVIQNTHIRNIINEVVAFL